MSLWTPLFWSRAARSGELDRALKLFEATWNPEERRDARAAWFRIPTPSTEDNSAFEANVALDLELASCAAATTGSWQAATVNRARHYIRSRAGEAITPRSVAEALNVNPSYLSREFKRVTRLTVTEYIAQQKVELACAILADPNVPITEVADRAGFNSLPRFFAVFKRRTGVTASEYRQTLSRARTQLVAS